MAHCSCGTASRQSAAMASGSQRPISAFFKKISVAEAVEQKEADNKAAKVSAAKRKAAEAIAAARAH